MHKKKNYRRYIKGEGGCVGQQICEFILKRLKEILRRTWMVLLCVVSYSSSLSPRQIFFNILISTSGEISMNNPNLLERLLSQPFNCQIHPQF